MMVGAVFRMVLANTMITSPVEFFSSPSKIDCMAKCLSTDWCHSASYSEQQQNCSLDQNYIYDINMYLHEEPGWDYYEMHIDLCPRHLSYVFIEQPVLLCYKIYDDIKLNQTEARDHCKADGGDLITLDTWEKNEFIQTVLSNTTTAEYFSIGLQNIDGYWVWPSGQNMIYSNWGNGEPNSVFETCTALHKTINYYWFNDMCHQQENFICEINIYETDYWNL